MRPSTQKKFLTEEQAEEILRLSRTALWRLRKSGTLPYYRLGGKVLYDHAEILAWLKGQRGNATVRETAPDYALTRPTRRSETDWKAAIEAQDWAFHDASTNSLTHALHPYPAKFPPQIPERLIEILTSPGQIVLDPFCGSGTTLVEALRLGRGAVGTDVNPVAILASEAKTLLLAPRSRLELVNHTEAIETDAARERGEPVLFDSRWPPCTPLPAPSIPNVERWFSPIARRELGIILARIKSIKTSAARVATQATFSSILVAASNQDSETRYTSREKAHTPGSILAIYARKLADTMGQLAAFAEVRGAASVMVAQADARALPSNSIGHIDAVITSPPYANAFDYHLYHRHRMYWLGHEPAALRDLEIGSHLNYQRRGEGIETYRHDMRACFASLSKLLRSGSPVAMIVGDSLIHGEVLDNASIILDVANDTGFRCITVVERRIHPIRRSMINAARRARIEKIILLVRR